MRAPKAPTAPETRTEYAETVARFRALCDRAPAEVRALHERLIGGYLGTCPATESAARESLRMMRAFLPREVVS